MAAFETFLDDAARRGTRIVPTNVQPEVLQVIANLGLTEKPAVMIAKNLERALIAVRIAR